jgi:hypothetical protein
MKKFCILFLFLLPVVSEANQISGYISLKYISGTTYQATVVTYSAGNPSLDSVQINWGNGDSSFVHRSNGAGVTVCDSVLMSIYTAIHSYPGPGTYNIWFNGGNRIANIENMSNSSFYDFIVFNTLTIGSITGDSIGSPLIVNPPICSYGCPSQCYTFNLGAYSPSGDSLSYSLGSCIMTNGYFIPANASIDAVTGKLSWCNPPSLAGQWNFSIRITSYKRVIIAGHPHQLPVDTTEVELDVNVQNNCSLGIDEINNAKECIVYPNPNKGKFTIQSATGYQLLANSSLEIYNMLGERIKSEELIDKNTTVDISSQPGGIYLYRVLTETGDLVSEGKFVIE